jgi:hypothetical protein
MTKRVFSRTVNPCRFFFISILDLLHDEDRNQILDIIVMEQVINISFVKERRVCWKNYAHGLIDELIYTRKKPMSISNRSKTQNKISPRIKSEKIYH